MELADGFTWGWIAILGAGGVLEAMALLRKEKGDTLSEHVWKWFAVKGKPTGYKVRRTALTIGMLWLTAHFLSGGAV